MFINCKSLLFIDDYREMIAFCFFFFERDEEKYQNQTSRRTRMVDFKISELDGTIYSLKICLV